MADLDRYVETSEVGDDADAESTYATVVGHDDLRYGAHAYGVASHHAIHLVFGRCLEGGALYADVHAIGNTDVLLTGYGCGFLNQSHVVSLVHVREAGTGREVLAAQRVFGEEIDVVSNNHQVADLERWVHAAGSVRNEEGLDAQFVHDAHGEGDLLHVVAFVIVEAALHGQDVNTTKLTEDKLSGMSFYGGHGEIGDVAVGYFCLVSYFGS